MKQQYKLDFDVIKKSFFFLPNINDYQDEKYYEELEMRYPLIAGKKY